MRIYTGLDSGLISLLQIWCVLFSSRVKKVWYCYGKLGSISNLSFSIQLTQDLTLPILSAVQECLHRGGLVALPPPGSCQHWVPAPSCHPQLVVLVPTMIIKMVRFLSLQTSKHTPLPNSSVPPRASGPRRCLGRADSERFTRDGLMRRPWTRPRVALAWWSPSRSSILRACREWSNGRYSNSQVAVFLHY